MRPVQPNFEVLYADLLQSLQERQVRPASVSTRKVKGRSYLYLTRRDGAGRKQEYLGPADDPDIKRYVQTVKTETRAAAARRTTVSALRRARLPAPPALVGRVLEVIDNAKLFDQGLVLVGTHAFRLYVPVLGQYLPQANLATNDVDISAAAFVRPPESIDFEDILKRADPAVEPVWREGDKAPAKFRLQNLTVDILTRKKRGGKSPVLVDGLGVSGEALAFQEYLTERTIEVAALHSDGVLVSVPEPARFAVHKLIVAQRRPEGSVKRRKDLRQAENIIEAMLISDPDTVEDAIADGRGRGRQWKSAINTSLKTIAANSDYGTLPL